MHLAGKNGRELLEKTEIESMVRFAAKTGISINPSLDEVERVIDASETQLTSHATETLGVARRMTTLQALPWALLKN